MNHTFSAPYFKYHWSCNALQTEEVVAKLFEIGEHLQRAVHEAGVAQVDQTGVPRNDYGLLRLRLERRHHAGRFLRTATDGHTRLSSKDALAHLTCTFSLLLSPSTFLRDHDTDGSLVLRGLALASRDVTLSLLVAAIPLGVVFLAASDVIDEFLTGFHAGDDCAYSSRKLHTKYNIDMKKVINHDIAM